MRIRATDLRGNSNFQALKATGSTLLPTNTEISVSPLSKEEVEQNDVKLEEVSDDVRTKYVSSFDRGAETKGCLNYAPESKMLDISLKQL